MQTSGSSLVERSRLLDGTPLQPREILKSSSLAFPKLLAPMDVAGKLLRTEELGTVRPVTTG